jgi:hypothetical protein
MKYIKTVVKTLDNEILSITVDEGQDKFTNFSANIDNSIYQYFLIQAQLTDKKVHELTPDTWYDLPEVTE